MENEPTMKDVLVAMQDGFRAVNERIDKDVLVAMQEGFRAVNDRIDKDVLVAMQEGFQAMATHIDEQNQLLRAEMATKDELRASEHRMMDFVDRRVDGAETRLGVKIGTLVDVLEKNDVITPHEIAKVLRA